MPVRSVGEHRLPQQFGGWWREHAKPEADQVLGTPTGREIELRCGISADGSEVETREVVFRGFSDSFERQGLPAMLDYTVMFFSLLDGDELTRLSTSGVLRGSTATERDDAISEQRRRRRRNAIPVDRVAVLWPIGGASSVIEEFDVSEATAYRWRRAAIDAGQLLADS